MFGPHELLAPLWVWNGAAWNTAVVDWAASAPQDTTANAPNSAITWSRDNPVSFFQDSGSIKTAPQVVKLPGTQSISPTLMQMASAEMNCVVGVPYNGQCTTSVVSEGHSPHTIGRRQAIRRFAAPITSGQSTNIEMEFLGHFHEIRTSETSETPVAFAMRHGQTTLQTGAGNEATMHFCVPAAPDQCWYYAGILDSTDAPDNGITSVANNMMPRHSGAAVVKNGMICVQNTGTTNVSMIISAHAVIHALIPQDTQDTTIPTLAGALREQANNLENRGMARVGDLCPLPGFSGASEGEIDKKRRDWAIQNLGASPSVASAMSEGHPQETAVVTVGKAFDGAVAIASAAGGAALGQAGGRIATGLVQRAEQAFYNFVGNLTKGGASGPGMQMIEQRALPMIEEVL